MFDLREMVEADRVGPVQQASWIVVSVLLEVVVGSARVQGFVEVEQELNQRPVVFTDRIYFAVGEAAMRTMKMELEVGVEMFVAHSTAELSIQADF
jgi:hypothetical protein